MQSNSVFLKNISKVQSMLHDHTFIIDGKTFYYSNINIYDDTQNGLSIFLLNDNNNKTYEFFKSWFDIPIKKDMLVYRDNCKHYFCGCLLVSYNINEEMKLIINIIYDYMSLDYEKTKEELIKDKVEEELLKYGIIDYSKNLD
jgi:hypothetical protein